MRSSLAADTSPLRCRKAKGCKSGARRRRTACRSVCSRTLSMRPLRRAREALKAPWPLSTSMGRRTCWRRRWTSTRGKVAATWPDQVCQSDGRVLSTPQCRAQNTARSTACSSQATGAAEASARPCGSAGARPTSHNGWDTAPCSSKRWPKASGGVAATSSSCTRPRRLGRLRSFTSTSRKARVGARIQSSLQRTVPWRMSMRDCDSTQSSPPPSPEGAEAAGNFSPAMWMSPAASRRMSSAGRTRVRRSRRNSPSSKACGLRVVSDRRASTSGRLSATRPSASSRRTSCKARAGQMPSARPRTWPISTFSPNAFVACCARSARQPSTRGRIAHNRTAQATTMSMTSPPTPQATALNRPLPARPSHRAEGWRGVADGSGDAAPSSGEENLSDMKCGDVRLFPDLQAPGGALTSAHGIGPWARRQRGLTSANPSTDLPSHLLNA